MAKTAYYEDICRFLKELKTQDDTTVMYKTATQLFEMCKVTDFMANIEEDAANLADNFEVFDVDAEEGQDLGEEVSLDYEAPIDIQDGTFNIEEFRHALERG